MSEQIPQVGNAIFTNAEDHKTESSEIFEIYDSMLSQYTSIRARQQVLKRRFPGIGPDPEVSSALITLDEELHNVHLELLEQGSKIGKSRADVLTDILRYAGSLTEYGLPEFSILKPVDLLSADGWHSVDTRFNVSGQGAGPPQRTSKEYQLRETSAPIVERLKQGEPFSDSKEEEMYATLHTHTFTTLSTVGLGQVVVVFQVAQAYNFARDRMNPQNLEIKPGESIDFGGMKSGALLRSADTEIRTSRAERLAEATHLPYIEISDGFFHSAAEYHATIAGVVVPTEKLEDICRIIREQPDLYRIDSAYYSDEEKRRLEESHRRDILDNLSGFILVGYRDPNNLSAAQAYFKLRHQLFGEPIPSPDETKEWITDTVLYMAEWGDPFSWSPRQEAVDIILSNPKRYLNRKPEFHAPPLDRQKTVQKIYTILSDILYDEQKDISKARDEIFDFFLLRKCHYGEDIPNIDQILELTNEALNLRGVHNKYPSTFLKNFRLYLLYELPKLEATAQNNSLEEERVDPKEYIELEEQYLASRPELLINPNRTHKL